MADPDNPKSADLEPKAETQGGLSGRQIVIHGAILLLLPLASLVLLRAILTLWPVGEPLTESAVNGLTFWLFIPCLAAAYFFAKSRHVDQGISLVLLGAWFVFARFFLET